METSPTKPFNIAIIGGGIAGLTLTISLLRHNIPVTLYESASRFGEIGAGVGFDAGTVRIMDLISPKIKEGFQRCANTTNQSKDWFTVRVGDHKKAGKDGVVRGKEEPGLRIGDPVFEVPILDTGVRGGVHRAHFLDELVKLVPEDVPKFGKKLVYVREDGEGDVVLHFADGTTARHDAVIGCDGIKSRTREVLLGDDPAAKAVFSGKYAYRGLIPMEQAVEMLGEEAAQASTSQMYVGYHGHVLTFPIAKGTIMNVVAFSSRDTWTDPNWVVHASKDEMLADYSDWGPTVLSIVSAMQKPDIWALFNHPPAPTYYKSRICLLGDAAHASTPHQGAGACMCIEDCYVLGSLMAEAHNVQDLEKVFKAYDAVRRPRTQRLVKTSREAGMLYEFEGVPEGDNLEAIERNMKARMSWIWNADIPADLEKAKQMLREKGVGT